MSTSDCTDASMLVYTLIRVRFPDVVVSCNDFGTAGGGGFIIDSGPDPIIKAMQYNDAGLRVRVDQNGWYSVLQITTEERKEVEKFLRTCNIKCTAPPTKWPPTEMQIRLTRFKRRASTVALLTGMIIASIPAALMEKAREKWAKKKN